MSTQQPTSGGQRVTYWDPRAGTGRCIFTLLIIRPKPVRYKAPNRTAYRSEVLLMMDAYFKENPCDPVKKAIWYVQGQCREMDIELTFEQVRNWFNKGQ